MFFCICQEVNFLGCILIWWVILVQKLPHLWVLRSVLLLEPFCAVSVPLGLDLVLNLEKGMCFFVFFFCVFLCLALRETIKTRMCFWIREQKRGCVFRITENAYVSLIVNQKRGRGCVFGSEKKRACVFSGEEKTRMCFLPARLYVILAWLKLLAVEFLALSKCCCVLRFLFGPGCCKTEKHWVPHMNIEMCMNNLNKVIKKVKI